MAGEIAPTRLTAGASLVVDTLAHKPRGSKYDISTLSSEDWVEMEMEERQQLQVEYELEETQVLVRIEANQSAMGSRQIEHRDDNDDDGNDEGSDNESEDALPTAKPALSTNCTNHVTIRFKQTPSDGSAKILSAVREQNSG